MIRECNLNFAARQCVVYLTTGEVIRLIDNDFISLEALLPALERSIVKTPEQLENEKQVEITKLKEEVVERQKRIDELSK